MSKKPTHVDRMVKKMLRKRKEKCSCGGAVAGGACVSCGQSHTYTPSDLPENKPNETPVPGDFPAGGDTPAGGPSAPLSASGGNNALNYTGRYPYSLDRPYLNNPNQPRGSMT